MKQISRWFKFSVVAIILLASAIGVAIQWPQASVSLAANTAYPLTLRQAYGSVVRQVHDLKARQTALHQQIVSDRELTQRVSLIQIDAASGHYGTAMNDIQAVQLALVNWNLELSGKGGGIAQSSQSGAAINLSGTGTYLPILIYHFPPPNFDQQLSHLTQAGYTVIDLDQALIGLSGGPLPAKPVVITFDDGFEAQMSAFALLQKHNMKATFYVMTAGEASKWCIGAGRRYGDPLQPASGCGDSYLTWDQVRILDTSGLITIAGHTINHRNLASLSEADQRFEIQTGKTMIEQQLGHKIAHFAYPYGAFNAVTIKIVQQSGYQTAVTTLGGAIQPPGSAFVLRRVRDALVLP